MCKYTQRSVFRVLFGMTTSMKELFFHEQTNIHGCRSMEYKTNMWNCLQDSS